MIVKRGWCIPDACVQTVLFEVVINDVFWRLHISGTADVVAVKHAFSNVLRYCSSFPCRTPFNFDYLAYLVLVPVKKENIHILILESAVYRDALFSDILPRFYSIYDDLEGGL